MPLPEIGVRAVVDMSQFMTGMNQYERGLQQMGTTTTAVTSQISQRFLSMAQGIMTTVAGIGLASLAKDIAMTAARTQTLGIVMEVVGRNAQFTSTELAIQEENVRRLGITTQAARQSLTQMMQAQLDVNQATKLARVAQDAAVVANVNSSQAFETLMHAVITLQPEMARNYGIVINLEAAYRKFAIANKISTEAITGSQKQQIMLNEVISEGVRLAGSYEMAMTTPGKALTSLARYVEEAKNAMGEGMLPAMKTGIDVATEFLKVIIDMPKPLKEIASYEMTLAAGAGMIIGPLQTVGSIFGSLKLVQAATSMELYANAQRNAIPPTVTMTSAIELQNLAFRQQAIQALTAGEAVAVGSRVATTGVATSGAAMGAAAVNAGKMGTAVKLLGGAFLALAIIPVIPQLWELAQSLENTIIESQLAGDSSDKLAQKYAANAKSLQQSKDLFSFLPDWFNNLQFSGENVVILDKMVGKYKELTDLFDKAATKENPIIKSPVNAIAAMEKLIKLQDEYNKAAEVKLPQVRAQLINASMIPALAPEVNKALEKIATDGASVIAKSAAATLTEAEISAIRSSLPALKEYFATTIKFAIDIGDLGLAEKLRRQLDVIVAAVTTGLTIRIPITIETVVTGQLNVAKAALTAENEKYNASTEVTQKRLQTLGWESDQLSIDQMRLGLSIQSASQSMQAQQEVVSGLNQQLSEARQRLQELGSAQLTGFQELDDELFATSQAMAQLQTQMNAMDIAAAPGIAAASREVARLRLELLLATEQASAMAAEMFNLDMAIAGLQLQATDIDLAYAPELNAANKEVLKLRLALLMTGDAAETVKQGMQFDIVGAMQKELREGVPIIKQFLDAASKQDETKPREVSVGQKALQDAERRVQILQLQKEIAKSDVSSQQEVFELTKRRLGLVEDISFKIPINYEIQVAERKLAVIQAQKDFSQFDLKTQQEILSLTEQRLNLLKQTEFEPKIREIQLRMNPPVIMNFEDIIAGIDLENKNIADLSLQLVAANNELAGRKAGIDGLQSIQEGMQRQATLNRIEQAELNLAQSKITAQHEEDVKRLQAEIDRLQAAVDFVPSPEALAARAPRPLERDLEAGIARASWTAPTTPVHLTKSLEDLNRLVDLTTGKLQNLDTVKPTLNFSDIENAGDVLEFFADKLGELIGTKPAIIITTELTPPKPPVMPELPTITIPAEIATPKQPDIPKVPIVVIDSKISHPDNDYKEISGIVFKPLLVPSKIVHPDDDYKEISGLKFEPLVVPSKIDTPDFMNIESAGDVLITIIGGVYNKLVTEHAAAVLEMKKPIDVVIRVQHPDPVTVAVSRGEERVLEAGIPRASREYGGVVPGPPGSPQIIEAHGGERFMGSPTNWNVNITQNYPGQDVLNQLRRDAQLIRLTRG